MPALIAFRLVQGLGAGAIQPIGMTIVGDIYSLAERAKVQGYIASVWAIASFVGPTLGGVFSDYLSWRWIFFVNLPLGIAAGWVLWRRFDENVEPRKHAIDYAGAVLLAAGGSLLLLGLLEGGVRWDWDSTASIGIFAAAAVLLAAFVLVESRTPEPVLPLWVFRRRVLNAANSGRLRRRRADARADVVRPALRPGRARHGALVAGLALAAMTIGWPIAAATSGRFYLTHRVPHDGADRRGVRDRRGGAAAAGELRQRPVAAGPAVLRDGHRVRVRRQPRRRRRPVQRRLGAPRRGDRHQHVRPVGRQRGRRRRLRRDRQQSSGRQRASRHSPSTSSTCRPVCWRRRSTPCSCALRSSPLRCCCQGLLMPRHAGAEALADT